MGEAGIASVQDRQMAANLAAQQQAVAFMAQQQITAAVTMGAFPFGAPAAATHGMVTLHMHQFIMSLAFLLVGCHYFQSKKLLSCASKSPCCK